MKIATLIHGLLLPQTDKIYKLYNIQFITWNLEEEYRHSPYYMGHIRPENDQMVKMIPEDFWTLKMALTEPLRKKSN